MELADVLKTGELHAEVSKEWDKKMHAVKTRPTLEEELNLLDCEAPPRFAASDPLMMKHLDEHGYVVVKGAADPVKDLPRLRSLLWDFLEMHTAAPLSPKEGTVSGGRRRRQQGWVRGDASTWSDEGLCQVGSPTVGILNGRGIGHCEFLWAVRELPTVREAFAAVWGLSSSSEPGNLATSFDGANVFRPYDWPPADADAEASALPSSFNLNVSDTRRTSGGWWHVDQGASKCGARHSVQGLLSLFDADATTGGLCVMPGTHLRHAELVRDVLGLDTAPRWSEGGFSSTDFLSVPPSFPGFRTLKRRLVACRGGDLVLWDSRTFHCNTPAPKPTPTPQRTPQPTRSSSGVGGGESCMAEPCTGTELLRAVAYVCMTPSALLDTPKDPDLRARRRAAYAGRVTTSHWPHELHPGSEPSAACWCAGSPGALDYDAASPLRKSLIG